MRVCLGALDGPSRAFARVPPDRSRRSVLGQLSGTEREGRRGPVSRILSPGSRPGWRPFLWGDCCQPPQATHRRFRAGHATSSLVLLQVGFAEHPSHPGCWCGNTPFSPHPASGACRPSLFCGTFPRSLEAAVSGHLALWSPDFPPGDRPRAAARPSPDILF